MSETMRIKAQTPKDVAIETALNTVLNGRVKVELGSSVDKESASDCISVLEKKEKLCRDVFLRSAKRF